MNPPNRPGFSLNGLSTKAKVGIGCGGFFALMFIAASCAAVVDTLANGAPEEEPAAAEASPSPEPEPEETEEADEPEQAEEPEPSHVERVEYHAIDTLGPGHEDDNEPKDYWHLITGWGYNEDEGEGHIVVDTSMPHDSPYVDGAGGELSSDVAATICTDVAFMNYRDDLEIMHVSVRDENGTGIRGCEPFV